MRSLWQQAVFFFRPPEPLGRSNWLLLLALGTTNVINAYDFSILTLALPQIQTDLGVSEEEIGRVISVVRLGVIPAESPLPASSRFLGRPARMLTQNVHRNAVAEIIAVAIARKW